MARLYALVILVVCSVAQADEQIDALETHNFKVFLNDRPVGWHRFTVQEKDDQLHVTSRASMDFTVLLVKSVNYRHLANETWEDGCLISFDSETIRNGKKIAVNGELINGAFRVVREDAEDFLGACVKSFPYWKPEWLESEYLLNVETGKYIAVSIASTTDPTTGADHKILGLPKTKIDLHYDGSGVWQSLESKIKVAGTLVYKRVNDSAGEEYAD
ncbi:MAG: DUF6134 family protein [Porticoccaceae bacterium]|nr:DUF6134 family protein [Porticoccaceae bacterium]MDG1474027.1 DUF6134 family protein [Porticoccaceae bacterium]